MTMSNRYVPVKASAIIPLDATNVDFNRILVGGAGNLVVTTADGSLVTIAVIAGQMVELAVAKVMTATTATVLVGLK